MDAHLYIMGWNYIAVFYKFSASAQIRSYVFHQVSCTNFKIVRPVFVFWLWKSIEFYFPT